MNEYGKTVCLSNNGYEVVVAPEMGFSIVGLHWKGINILADGSEQDFLLTRKGLGPLILPHFNQFGFIPSIDKHKFPHIQALENIGIRHPFQHGIGRYVPWKNKSEGTKITGEIDGDIVIQGYRYAELAGFDFKALVTYDLTSHGLLIAIDIRGEKPVAAGIHFYYNLFSKEAARIFLPRYVQNEPITCDKSLNNVYDVAASNQTSASCFLHTEKYSLETSFSTGTTPETSFDSLVVFHPEKSNFICIEPISYMLMTTNTKMNFQGTITLRLHESW
jgi:hypothetical protein